MEFYRNFLRMSVNGHGNISPSMGRDYQYEMDLFYSRIGRFIQERPDLISELEEKLGFFTSLLMPNKDKRMLALDWFVFDAKSKALRGNPLDCFLKEADLNEETKQLYRNFRQGKFSLFEVKALRIGKGMLLINLLDNQEHQVFDISASKILQKGQCCLLRMLPFEDYFILTGVGYPFPAFSTPALRLIAKNMREAGRPIHLSPLQVCEILFAAPKREQLPVRERFELICLEHGLSSDETRRFLDEMRSKALQKEDNDGLAEKLFVKLKPRPGFNARELSEAFVGTWNSFVAEQPDYVEKGPMETMLVRAAMDYVGNRVKLDGRKNKEKLEARMNELQKEWLHSPLEELEGKTPAEVILEERQQLGNPQKEIGFTMQINKLKPGIEEEQKMNALLDEARGLMQEKHVPEAIAIMESVLREYPDACPVWQNLGIAYVLSQDRLNAQRCFEKALEINPKYEMARHDLERLMNSSDEDLARAAFGGQVVSVKPGRKKRIPTPED